MGAIGALVGKLLDPIGFAITVVVILFSREKWIILVAAVVAAVTVETLISSSSYTRAWGQGLPVGFVASLIHAGLAFFIVSRIREKRERGSSSDTDPDA